MAVLPILITHQRRLEGVRIVHLAEPKGYSPVLILALAAYIIQPASTR
jgi:hypothetical protein